MSSDTLAIFAIRVIELIMARLDAQEDIQAQRWYSVLKDMQQTGREPTEQEIDRLMEDIRLAHEMVQSA